MPPAERPGACAKMRVSKEVPAVHRDARLGLIALAVIVALLCLAAWLIAGVG